MPYPREFIAVPIPGGEWQVRLHPSGTTIEDPGATHLTQGDEPRILVLTVWPGQRPPIVRLLAWRGGAYVDEPISQGVCQAWLTLLSRWGQLCLDPARCEGVLQTIPRDLSLPLNLICRPCTGQFLEESALDYRDIWTTRDLFNAAPPTSLLGVITQLGLQQQLWSLVHRRYRRHWLDLITPLWTPLSTAGEGASTFSVATSALLEDGNLSQLLPASHLDVHVRCDGVISLHVTPANIFALPRGLARWPLYGSDKSEQTDRWSLNQIMQSAIGTTNRILDALEAGRITVQGHAPDRQSGRHLMEPPADWKVRILAAIQDQMRQIEKRIRPRLDTNVGIDGPLFLSNWLTAAPSGPVRSRRQQALKAMPSSIPAIVYEARPEVLDAIDHGRPLCDSISASYGISTAVARRVLHAGVARYYGDFPCTDLRDPTPFSTAAQLIEDLGPGCPPPNHDALARLDLLMCRLPLHPAGVWPRDWNPRRLLRAIGATARKSGWLAAGPLLDRLGPSRLSVALLERVMEGTVDLHLGPNDLRRDHEYSPQQRDLIVDAWFGSMGIAEWLARAERLARLPLQMDLDVLGAALRAAKLEWIHTGKEGASGMSTPTVALFAHMTWVTTQVGVIQLQTMQDLEHEGRRMHNCIASYWQRVQLPSSLLLALEDTAGTRANAELVVGENRRWHVVQLKGAHNRSIPEWSPIARTAQEIADWLTTRPKCIQEEILTAFRSHEPELSGDEYFQLVEGVSQFYLLAEQCLDDALLPDTLACLPGAGTLETRLRHATRRARKAPAFTQPTRNNRRISEFHWDFWDDDSELEGTLEQNFDRPN